MNTTLFQSLSILLIFLALVGYVLQPHAQQFAEADAQKTMHEEPAKAGMPTLRIALEHDLFSVAVKGNIGPIA